MNYFCNSKDFAKTLDACVKDTQKRIRNAAYKTLENVAERSRRAVIANYFKKFPDENGIHKNKGVPQQVTKSRVNKEKLEISLYTKDKIDFMYDQEFGGERKSKYGETKAVPFLSTRQEGRNSRGGMKSAYSVKTLMQKALSSSGKTAKRSGKPKPFLMTTKSGHRIIAQRTGKNRLPIKPLYHFDKKVKIRPRWDFVKTVEGVTVHYIEKTFEKELQKVIDKN